MHNIETMKLIAKYIIMFDKLNDIELKQDVLKLLEDLKNGEYDNNDIDYNNLIALIDEIIFPLEKF